MLETITQIEERAFEVFRQNGLPDRRGVYRREPDGTLICVRDLSGRQPAMIEQPMSDPGREHFYHYQLASGGNANSALDLAADILEQAHRCRVWQGLGKWTPERAFVEAIQLANDMIVLLTEFELAHLIAPTLSQIAGRQAGGIERARAVKKDAAARRAEWLKFDDSLKSLKSKSDRAKKICDKFKGTVFAASRDTIRKALPPRKKLDGS